MWDFLAISLNIKYLPNKCILIYNKKDHTNHIYKKNTEGQNLNAYFWLKHTLKSILEKLKKNKIEGNKNWIKIKIK